GEEGEKAFLEAYKHEGDAALKMAQDNLKERLKSYEIERKEIEKLIALFGRGRFGGTTLLDVGEVDKVNTKLKQFDATVEGVDRHFGSASRTLDQLNRMLDILFGNLTANQRMTLILTEAWQNFEEEMIKSGKLFELVGQGIEQAFESIVSGQESSGDAMKKMMLNLVA